MSKTSIEWAKNPDGSQGFTWNPITGCLNHVNGLCKGGNFPCYAYRLANGRLRQAYFGGNCIPAPFEYNSQVILDPFYPRFWPEKLDQPLKRKKPAGIFVCDMSDLFGIGIPEQWTWSVFNFIKECPQHRFYLLTKQPQNLIKFSPFPENAWVGVTVTKPEFFFPALDALDSIQCSIRSLSIEPMLAAFDVPDLSLLLEGSVDWLILGAQTKPYRPPTIQSVEEIVRAADQAGIPVFLKDNLEKLAFNYKWPEIEEHWSLFDRIDHVDDFILGATMRQEMPE